MSALICLSILAIFAAAGIAVFWAALSRNAEARRRLEGECRRLGALVRDLSTAVEKSGGRAAAERLRADQELLERLRRQSALVELGEQALAVADISVFIEETVAAVAGVLRVDFCEVFELQPDGKALVLRAGAGWKQACVGRTSVGAGSDSQAGYTLLFRAPVVVEDLSTETRFKGSQLLADHGVVSGVSVPIEGREQPFGVLGAHAMKRRAFGEDDVYFLQAVAHLIALAVERKSSDAQLLQSQKVAELGTFAGSIAHDFNNLLTQIGGFAELAQLDLPPNSPARPDIQEVLKASERAAALVRRLLAFSRKQPAEAKPIKLSEVVRGMEKMLLQLLGANIQLLTAEDPLLGFVRADPYQIEQVVMNLAVNARDAMSNRGKLTLEMRNAILGEQYASTLPGVLPGEYVMLAVADTGCGMPEEVKQHLFEPFFTTKENGRGTGLGLSTCYEIVRQAGGHIVVDSEPGEGTTMRVYLPRVRQADLGSQPRGAAA